MSDAIGPVLAFGVGVTLSPLAIIAVILMLGTPRGRLTATSFILAWALGLAVLGTAVLLLADGADASEEGTPATWVSILKLALGVLLLFLAARQWSEWPRGESEPELPTWMQRVETFTPTRAAAIALALSSLKPKNLLLTIGAATAIAETGAGTAQQAAAVAVFVLIGTLGPGLPVAIHLAMGDRAPDILTGIRNWMVRENATIIMVLCLVIGANLIGDAVSALG